MQEQLITFEIAKLAKEKGFNDSNQQRGYNNEGVLEMCSYSLYVSNEDFKETNLYAAPTQSLLQRWLREVHFIHIPIEESYNTETEEIRYYPVLFPFKGKFKEINDCSRIYLGDVWTDTYEEALEQGLIEALKLI